MSAHQHNARRPARTTRGFTLIELLKTADQDPADAPAQAAAVQE